MFAERVLLAGGASYELFFRSPSDWRLACLKEGRLLVEYRSSGAYAFKSVEKLRYDFERDAQIALRQA